MSKQDRIGSRRKAKPSYRAKSALHFATNPQLQAWDQNLVDFTQKRKSQDQNQHEHACANMTPTPRTEQMQQIPILEAKIQLQMRHSTSVIQIWGHGRSHQNIVEKYHHSPNHHIKHSVLSLLLAGIGITTKIMNETSSVHPSPSVLCVTFCFRHSINATKHRNKRYIKTRQNSHLHL